MPTFVEKTLEQVQHKQPLKPQHAPHEWSQPIYSQKPQLAPPTNTSTPLLLTWDHYYTMEERQILKFHQQSMN